MILLSILRVGIGWHFLYEAFPYVFENGADFLCVGMYDFQLVDDVNITLNTLDKTKIRKRHWRA